VPLSRIIHDLAGMAYQGASLLDRVMRGGRPPKQILGVPPKGIFMRVSTEDEVVAIAWQTGFTRPSHLFRAFRAHFRTSPKRFRLRALRTR
jgi:hypothetical protein